MIPYTHDPRTVAKGRFQRSERAIRCAYFYDRGTPEDCVSVLLRMERSVPLVSLSCPIMGQTFLPGFGYPARATNVARRERRIVRCEDHRLMFYCPDRGDGK
jgi:hypothetical protein